MNNFCSACGVCCKLFLINLSQKEYEQGDYQTMFQSEEIIKNFSQAKSCGANLLAKKVDNSCIYLVDKKCSIHKQRPMVCRHFFCNSKNKKFAAMIEMINQQKSK